ncbi:DEAD/DEAH box helicase [Burkholderia plantarii]|uniref:DEAD-box ATP-dependent RNA helicase RhpA n=1 Tax=Burkholderia plantarii TaxID=41899 RepID=A0A0B6S913_BURPL|nr:DEAD/DEAH box helicase [Burkholderia plantarii]AJK48741.1 DEAD/DEAH box helicase-like protein [Burkholderia plantarii]WLE62056.1 DEAD/DEAH box helicase [Burkholderia plantarii]
MSFASLGLIEPLLRNLRDLNYAEPTPVQAKAIPAVLGGKDVMAGAQTGTGKTAGFALPLLQRLVQQGPAVSSNRARVLVLVPTRELAEQVLQSFVDYGRGLDLRMLAAYGGVSINPQMMKLRKGVDVLVATPGRLLDLNRQNAVQFDQVCTLVLDEADRMLDLGFARELDAVFAALPARRQTLLFSATFSDDIRAMAAKLLREPVQISVSAPNATASRVRQWVVTVDKRNKPELFMHLLAENGWQHALVFAKTRVGVDYLAARLEEAGHAVDTIHGDKPQPARLRALERFKRGEVRMLVATDVAARGLDIDDLPLVINVDLPIVAQDYVHRIGRTGRAGASGVAVSLVCADEAPQLAAIEALIRQTLRREEEPGFEAEHRVPQTSTTGELIKKPKKPKKPKVPQAAPGGAQAAGAKPRAQGAQGAKRAQGKPKAAPPRAGAAGDVTHGSPFSSVRKPAGKGAGKSRPPR